MTPPNSQPSTQPERIPLLKLSAFATLDLLLLSKKYANIDVIPRVADCDSRMGFLVSPGGRYPSKAPTGIPVLISESRYNRGACANENGNQFGVWKWATRYYWGVRRHNFVA
jgi:hypothetical protein